MALVINSNVASLATQRSLSETQKESAVSLERLSSGLRINSAKDDAAGMAISNRLSAQINGLTTAMRNAMDGISLVQTAESAMGQITDNLQRMRELAVQSANGTNSTTDRTAMNTEFTQLRDEIERLADSTSFNGNNLLNGPAAMNIQVGADNAVSATTNRVTIATTALIDAQTATLGTGSTTTGGDVSQTLTIASANVADIAATELTINGTALAAGRAVLLIGAVVEKRCRDRRFIRKTRSICRSRCTPLFFATAAAPPPQSRETRRPRRRRAPTPPATAPRRDAPDRWSTGAQRLRATRPWAACAQTCGPSALQVFYGA